MAPPASPFVIVGRVRKAHGIRGELVVEAHTDIPDAVFAAGKRLIAGSATGAVSPDHRELHVVRSSPFKGGWIVAFHEITDRNTAELWRGRYFLVPADEAQPLEQGEVYLHELIGMRVALTAGEPVGVVSATYDLPQGLMLDVAREAGSVMVPYDRVVTSVDRTARLVTIDPPAGLLD